tara:strand:- start:3470 stop:4264 length:795 start_codon:yes stop_codon:yes gene_type:complete
MRVACLQLSSNKSYKDSTSQAIKLIGKAIKKNCDLIITPEATTILSTNIKDYYKYSFSMKLDPFIKKIKKIAKENKKWILIGSLFVKYNGKLRNRSVMISPEGKILAYYDKINMFDANLDNKEIHKESHVFQPGKKLKTVQLPWGKLGLTVCYDLRFPELFRNLSKKKINFISVPSAFTKITGKRHWIVLLRARAIENFCYIFAPAQIGKNHSNRETFGHSLIVSPDGKILKIKKKGLGIIYADIDPNLSMKLRSIIPSIKSYR